MENKQNEIWKKEADLLKQDLDNRPKEIKKREVEIKVGKKSPYKPNTPSKTNFSAPADDFLRKRLGL